MPWSATQQKRLGFEKNILEKYFGNRVSWINPTGDTKVEVRVTTTSDKQYTLRVYLPGDFPNSCPQMIVSNPSSCLRAKDGSSLSGMSGINHTLGSIDGCTLDKAISCEIKYFEQTFLFPGQLNLLPSQF